MIIDDDDEMRSFLRDALLKLGGYRVLTAADARSGLTYVTTDEPNLILLDLHLADVSGLDLLERLNQEGYHIPTIAISAYGSEESILRAFRLGVKDFLQKPFTVSQAQVAIENALTEERLRREKENLTQALTLANRRLQKQLHNWKAINDIAQAITSTLEESEVFQRVIENVNRVLQVQAGSLLLLDQEAGELEFAVTLGEDAARFSDLRVKLGEGIAGWVAQHAKPLLVPDVRQDPRFYSQIDRITGFQTHAVLCVPLKAKGQVIGVIEVINKQRGPKSPSFTQGDKELLTMLASWVSVAVENARLNRATQEMAFAKALGQTVATLAHHINNRLMSFSLELDQLEEDKALDQQSIRDMIASARTCIREVSAVVKALDRLEKIRTVPYVGTTEMIDIEKPLEKQLRLISAQKKLL